MCDVYEAIALGLAGELKPPKYMTISSHQLSNRGIKAEADKWTVQLDDHQWVIVYIVLEESGVWIAHRAIGSVMIEYCDPDFITKVQVCINKVGYWYDWTMATDRYTGG